jgi:hypothetical protein
MPQKKLLAIHLNEFNFDFLKKGSSKFKCYNIKKILSYKLIKTYSKDKEQDKNLDPWVQSVSINTGIESKDHKVFNLGQKIPKKINHIWDLLAKKKQSCAVWGAMNSSYNNSKYLKIYFPDPWNNNKNVKPDILKNIFYLPQAYAQNYTNFKILKNLKHILNFFLICLNFKILSFFFKNLFLYFKIFLKSGFSNYFLFFLFDIISLNIFKDFTQKKHLNFSLIFLNSLAHFQHNNWDEKENYYQYFLFTDEICRIIDQISKNYDDVVIYNGFTQKKIKPEYIIRPKDPNQFIRMIGVKYKKLDSNMTNGGIITFNSNFQKKKSLKILKQFNIFGFKLFEVNEIDNNNIFFRIQVKSYFNFNSWAMLKNKKIKNIVNKFSYDKKNLKLLKNNLNTNFDFFLENMIFIKTTGRHFFKGHLLTKNDFIKKNTINNKNIFLIIKKYFNN